MFRIKVMLWTMYYTILFKIKHLMKGKIVKWKNLYVLSVEVGSGLILWLSFIVENGIYVVNVEAIILLECG